MNNAVKTAATVAAVVLGLLLVALVASPNFRYISDNWIVLRDAHPKIASPLHGGTRSLPSVFLWAWERPEDLRFLGSKPAGVAFLAKTIYLSPASSRTGGGLFDGFLVRPRLQPLRVAPGMPLVAVVRIEPRGRLPFRSATIRELPPGDDPFRNADSAQIVSEIASLQSMPGVRAIQIDFDASLSERSFYAALLTKVRRQLSPGIPLSITALASWCIGDRWLERLPPDTIQEAVPMLFRMGPGRQDVLRFLQSANSFPVLACRSSLGISTDEPLPQPLLTRLTGLSFSRESKRVYVFTPRAWTQQRAQQILTEMSQ